MKHLILGSLALAASAALAGENFGGIGVTIYAEPTGVYVVDVIPGSPAADAGIEKDDHILAVDGNSLSGKTLDQSKDLLRGTVGKPLELSVLREKESFSVTLRRAHISVDEIESSDVESWYGEDKQSYSSEEIAEVARKSLGGNYSLLSVMQNGRVIPEESSVSSANLSSVSVEKDEVKGEIPAAKSATRPAGKLKGFSREFVRIFLYAEGSTVVRIVDANGNVIARLSKENAKAGSLALSWDGKAAAAGRYVVHVEQNGASSAAAAELR